MDAFRPSGECRAKGLIYQATGGPITPLRKGTKGPPAGFLQQGVAPFATAEVPGDPYPEHFHLISRHQGVTGKAGEDGFDARVYSENIAANKQNMAESKHRNYAGGGTPYATQDIDRASAFDRDFHLQETSKRLPDKIGSAAGFDPEAYRLQREANLELQQQSKHKMFGSSTGDDSSCPFATSDSDEMRQAWQRPDYHAKAQGRAMADKVGFEHSFDANVYSKNRTRNKEQQTESTQRNFVGSGDILAFD